MLYLRTIKDKYIEIYNDFISQLHIYAKAVRMLAKGYLPILFMTPLKLQEIVDSVKETLIKTNPDYDIAIKRLYLYYDIKLVTFRIDKQRNLMLYNILLLINCYTGNNTTKCHSGSMSDNRDLTGVFHQNVSSLPKVIASDSRYFQSS